MTTENPSDFVQLVTRVPRELKRRLKVHCLVEETSMMDFVLTAIRSGLNENGTPQRRKPRNGTR